MARLNSTPWLWFILGYRRSFSDGRQRVENYTDTKFNTCPNCRCQVSVRQCHPGTTFNNSPREEQEVRPALLDRSSASGSKFRRLRAPRSRFGNETSLRSGVTHMFTSVCCYPLHPAGMCLLSVTTGCRSPSCLHELQHRLPTSLFGQTRSLLLEGPLSVCNLYRPWTRSATTLSQRYGTLRCLTRSLKSDAGLALLSFSEWASRISLAGAC